MAQIQATVIQTGFSNATKTYTLADGDMDKAIAAYQEPANRSLSTPDKPPVIATRNQVLNYMFDKLIKEAIQRAVQTNETVPAQKPPPIPIT